MTKCLYCYRELLENETDFHEACAQAAPIPPHIDLCGEELSDVYLLTKAADAEDYAPALKDLVLHMAQSVMLVTAPHSLVRGEAGELHTLVRRADVGLNGEEVEMANMCVIDEVELSDRCRSSYEYVAEIVEECSSIAKVDIINYWERVLFAWIVGDIELHLENISLYEPQRGLCCLAPLYDVTAMNSNEKGHELALTLSGRRKGIGRGDFEKAMRKSGMAARMIKKSFAKFVEAKERWEELIDASFVSEDLKGEFKVLVNQRIDLIKVE